MHAPLQPVELVGWRVRLRTLTEADYLAWFEVRRRCREWLVPWEPRPAGAPPAPEDATSFGVRCGMRERERQLGTGYGFGIFVGERFGGEITLSSIQRGPFQQAFIGYWVDQQLAGQGLVPEAVVLVLQFAFEVLLLHRVEIAIVNTDPNHAGVVARPAALVEPGLAGRANVVFLTGPLPSLNAVWSHYGVQVRVGQPPAPVLHNDVLYFITTRGDLHALATPFANESPQGVFALDVVSRRAFAAGIAEVASSLLP